jgi:hypothetical protein
MVQQCVLSLSSTFLLQLSANGRQYMSRSGVLKASSGMSLTVVSEAKASKKNGDPRALALRHRQTKTKELNYLSNTANSETSAIYTATLSGWKPFMTL